MNWIDITILVILIYNVFVGYTNGLIRSLFGFLALIGAFFLAPIGKPFTMVIVQSALHWDKIILEPVAMGLSWIIIYIAISITGTIIFKLVKKTKLKLVDKLGGLLLGLFISAVIINVPLMIIDSLPFTQNIPQVKRDIKESTLLPVIAKPSRSVVEIAFKGLLNYWKIWMSKPDTIPKPPVTQKKIN